MYTQKILLFLWIACHFWSCFFVLGHSASGMVDIVSSQKILQKIEDVSLRLLDDLSLLTFADDFWEKNESYSQCIYQQSIELGDAVESLLVYGHLDFYLNEEIVYLVHKVREVTVLYNEFFSTLPHVLGQEYRKEIIELLAQSEQGLALMLATNSNLCSIAPS